MDPMKIRFKIRFVHLNTKLLYTFMRNINKYKRIKSFMKLVLNVFISIKKNVPQLRNQKYNSTRTFKFLFLSSEANNKLMLTQTRIVNPLSPGGHRYPLSPKLQFYFKKG